jgi:hypothetical protein
MEARDAGKGQRVELWTEKYRLIGQVVLPEGVGGSARLSDVVNNPNRMFLPLLRVSMYRRGDDQMISQHDFLLVNRAGIEILRPLD